jgi:hypothetical protein
MNKYGFWFLNIFSTPNNIKGRYIIGLIKDGCRTAANNAKPQNAYTKEPQSLAKRGWSINLRYSEKTIPERYMRKITKNEYKYSVLEVEIRTDKSVKGSPMTLACNVEKTSEPSPMLKSNIGIEIFPVLKK